MQEDNDDEDSEVNYKDPEESNKENQPPVPPLGFINNVPDHPFYYRIYVRNPQYRANEGIGPTRDLSWPPISSTPLTTRT